MIRASYRLAVRRPLFLGSAGAAADARGRPLIGPLASTNECTGTIVCDRSKPDGAPRKIMDSSRLDDLGWHPRMEFEDGLRLAHQWYVDNRVRSPTFVSAGAK
jgi:GDP-L-fucose synthase